MSYTPLKYYFGHELSELLALKLNAVGVDIDHVGMVREIRSKVDHLELKDRVEVIADALYTYLGEDYAVGVKLLLKILGPENEQETGTFTNFYWVMPIAKYIEKYGLSDFEISMKAMEEVTKRNTSEYAIRPYLMKYTERTLAQVLLWSSHPNRHVRRLSSEGIRPRLPWAKKMDLFIEDPNLLFPVLDNLKHDESRYVQKSVANCINDVLKDNNTIGRAWLDQWRSETQSDAIKWIIKHAYRNLDK